MNHKENSFLLSGYLRKWSGFVCGFKKQWFIIDSSHLIYYANERDAKLDHNLKGKLNLDELFVKTKFNLNEFHLKSFNKLLRLKAKTKQEKDRWLLALTLARNRLLVKNDESKLNTIQEELQCKIKELNAYNCLVQQHSILLKNALSDLLLNDYSKEDDIKKLLQFINQNTEQFKLIIHKMLQKCEYFASLSIDKCVLNDKSESNVDIYYDVIEPSADTHVNEVLVSKSRRKTIPSKPEYSLNLWKIVKTWIGRDLSKVFIPVNLCEPLSMIQRLAEDLEYYELLDRAANACDSSLEQMLYVAAFSISTYSTTLLRIAKPFSPCQGETYECDRWRELGWRYLGEKVSSTTIAFHAESKRGWSFYGEFTEQTRFRGHYLQMEPIGTLNVHFKQSNNHYTWSKVTTFVRNILMGRIIIDNVGECDIINHKTKDICHLKYYPQREQSHKVSGLVNDASNVAQYVLNGTWNEKLNYSRVINPQVISDKTQLNLDKSTCIWLRNQTVSNSEHMYNFTQFGIELNEYDECVAPTDSRMRSDIRLMEQGEWDKANEEKLRVEERSSTYTKRQHGHMAVWFELKQDPYTNQQAYRFTNEYWSYKETQNWKTKCKIDLF